MKVRRNKCKCVDCDYDCLERISFAPGSHSYTRRFARYVVDLLKGMTLKDTARLLGVSWDTIKEIHTHHLEYHYAPPSLEGVDSIGIDEFAVRKGHVYKTIVVDLKSGRILHVGQGKAADALAGFWKRVRRKKLDIKYIATDLSAAFISSVLENCPNAVHVFDHFHVVKLMNEKLDEIRRAQYNPMEKRHQQAQSLFYSVVESCPLYSSLNSVTVCPVCFLKKRIKCPGSEKLNSYANSLVVLSVKSISFLISASSRCFSR